ncbi:DUF4279 domain-containing protein [Ralstonia pseudosolanacearum]|uniref:DUF4279 domain-containing protein n=1 Tax=Ralstonia pseudosolanacearum TaxID=1310165 RepID=UPI002676D89E|nr:DUF4279 domain-containing protein [Ralstonia pseudosolanacearum]MDO3526763.1 DUF4279 domain-containing protein [Ralstonia pseudosolanacearum]MDO3534253.1 DUF4279 domain-containing protein [Ralstonia pseudosolanacearum]
MNAFRFSVSLRFSTKTVEPDEICSLLGLVPKWKHRIGEPRVNPKGALLGGVYESSYCSFRLTQVGDERLCEMLNRVADNLVRNKRLFHRIRGEGGRAEFFIGWYSPGNTGDTFDHGLLEKLSELKIDLALDVYGEA